MAEVPSTASGDPPGTRLSMMPIASARMYAWAPSLTAAWHRLLTWLSSRAEVPLTVLDQAGTLPLDDIWERDDLGCVLMCGYPWALRRDRPHLLAAPVPSPARYRDRPVYFTDFIVRDDSAYVRLEDTFGGCLAYSTEHSHSGYNAARFHLLTYRTPSRPTLYGRLLGPLHRQVPVIDAVIDGRADVGPVDGYALDLLRLHGDERARRVRVVATTAPAPSAPLVASPVVDAASRERLTVALLDAHHARELTTALDELLIARFVRIVEADLDVFLHRARAAEAAGYATLA